MDPVAPEIDIAMPEAGAYISVANVAIAGTAIDPLSGIETLTATVGGQALTPTLALPDWSASWTAPDVDGTQYTIAAAAVDKAGNWATETVTVTVDRVPPTNPTEVVETHGIANGASLPAPIPLHFEWSGASDGDGIAGYWVYWGRNAAGTATTFITTTEYSPPPLTVIGSYYLRIRTVDVAGNTAQWQTVFTVTLLSNIHKTYIPLLQVVPWARYEPNNTRATAYGPLQSGTAYQAYIWRAGDQDYYYIDVTATNTDITVDLTNIPANTDYDLYLYASATAPLPVASSAQYGNVDEHIRYHPAATGRYYIRIYPYQGASKQQPYHLKATFH
ncbi:MAG: pre-peptidase C-terminal domain-containing protein [Anaerolineae bacterium]|nr:pre-peptidase C-terminal domain-containing protein [Anaerolineae bacterium]MCB0203863.1 pre-peptidase C-terminal domain-containing protein [Anaerolineae bacterium]